MLTALAGCSTTPAHLPQHARSAFGDYLAKPDFKAFAVDNETGTYAWQSGYRRPSWAVERAMERCEANGSVCQVFAIGNRIVAGLPDEKIAKIKKEYFNQVVTAPQIGERGIVLSSKEIEEYVSGKTLKIKTNIGGLAVMKVFRNGKVAIRAINNEVSDTGFWYVKGAKFCRKFKKLGMGKLGCAQIVKDGYIFRAYSDGKFMSQFTIETGIDLESRE